MRGLAGQRVLVTGASGGIGNAVVERLRDEGCVLAVTDVVRPECSGVEYAAAADVTSEPDVAHVIATAEEVLGGIDSLVAVAGISVSSPTHELSLGDFRRVLDVSAVGTLLCVRGVLPGMLKRKSGRIVTFGSTAAVNAAAGLSAYAAAKGAVLQLTRSVAVEYARQGIRANCLCPGGTLTPLMEQIDAERDGPDHFREKHPIGRYAHTSEIASSVAFLLSEESSFVLGSAFMADGGYSCD